MRQVLPIIDEYMYTYQQKPEHINLLVLLQWLEGEGRMPATWGTLVETLKDIGLIQLAKEIQYVKTTAGTADEPPPTPAPGMMSMCCVGACVMLGSWAMYMYHMYMQVQCTLTFSSLHPQLLRRPLLALLMNHLPPQHPV